MFSDHDAAHRQAQIDRQLTRTRIRATAAKIAADLTVELGDSLPAGHSCQWEWTDRLG